jgi:hypothetical protein
MIARTLHPPQFNLTREIVLVVVNRTTVNGDTHHQEDVSLSLPQFNKIHEASIVRGEDVSNVDTIPDLNRMTHQILSMW